MGTDEYKKVVNYVLNIVSGTMFTDILLYRHMLYRFISADAIVYYVHKNTLK